MKTGTENINVFLVIFILNCFQFSFIHNRTTDRMSCIFSKWTYFGTNNVSMSQMFKLPKPGQPVLHRPFAILPVRDLSHGSHTNPKNKTLHNLEQIICIYNEFLEEKAILNLKNISHICIIFILGISKSFINTSLIQTLL